MHNAREAESLTDNEMRAGERRGWLWKAMIAGFAIAFIGMLIAFIIYGR